MGRHQETAMQSHRHCRKKQLEDPRFREGYLREKTRGNSGGNSAEASEVRPLTAVAREEGACHPTTVANIENGANYTIKTFLKIAEVLRINVSL